MFLRSCSLLGQPATMRIVLQTIGATARLGARHMGHGSALRASRTTSPLSRPLLLGHKRHYSTPPSNAALGSQLAQAHGLSDPDVQALRQATESLSVSVISRITDPNMARFLRKAAIDPIIDRIRSDPERSTFENEDVVKIFSATQSNDFSNFLMHLSPGGQNGRHVHPFGPRNLVVLSDSPWFLFCGAVPKSGQDPAEVTEFAKVEIPAGQYVVTFPANMPHGFDSLGDGTVAHSIHAFDLKEILAASIGGDSKDVMAQLTRNLGTEGMRIIGGAAVPLDVVLALRPGSPQ